jgi:predicted pyridoxine 5'-phosphate oxidase superfamily flavin-nucleotide-binding protein
MEQAGSWERSITADLKVEIEAQTSVFLATANSKGQPYIQHRGGPAGFLKVLDEHTIGFADFADFAGNRQYITQGNLEENPKVQLFLLDYAKQRRIKVWGTARVLEGDEALVQQLMPAGYRARPEQVILFAVTAWDVNCPQHIPQRFEAAEVQAAIAVREERIATLEAEVKRLRQERTPDARSQ